MLNQIQPTPLRIFIRCLLLLTATTILTLIGVIIQPVTGLSQFWVGYVCAYVFLLLFPSARF